MNEPVHPAASGPLPWFITTPGGTDMLMIVMAIVLGLFSLMIGLIYFRLHALPDRFAHQKVQFKIVCVLGLIAMFTHMHIFWIAGLLLALVDFPDFSTPLNRIAGSAEKLATKRQAITLPQHDESHAREVGEIEGHPSALKAQDNAIRRFHA